MKHFVNLDPCYSCGAYRYLALSERPKSFELVMVHQRRGKDGKRRVKTLISLKKSSLPMHP